MRRGAAIVGAMLVVACVRSGLPPVQPKVSAAALSGGPNTSLVYLARTTDGVIAIDLGWWGSTESVSRKLRELEATPAQVTHVFLTHSHRDHIGAWRLLRASSFHLARAELPRFLGDTAHKGWIPRAAERVNSSELPRDGELRIATFARDTTFFVGHDTLFAFLVPGHTAGSAAYLFRGILFLGDAATFTRWGGFAPARRGFSDDRTEAAANLEALWDRLPTGAVRHVCTAHAKCAAYSPQFIKDVRQ